MLLFDAMLCSPPRDEDVARTSSLHLWFVRFRNRNHFRAEKLVDDALDIGLVRGSVPTPMRRGSRRPDCAGPGPSLLAFVPSTAAQ